MPTPRQSTQGVLMSHRGAGEGSNLYEPGQKIYAKWPKSSLWYSAKVVELHSSGKNCTVEFEDGTVEDIPLKHVASERRFRSKSPARKRSRSRSRSRGRSRSPGRTKPKQSPSPARKPRSSSKSSSPSRQQQPKTPPTPTRQSARLQEKAEAKDNHVKEERSKTAQKSPGKTKGKPGTYYDLGGPIFAVVLMAICIEVTIFVNTVCSQTQCSIKGLPKFSTNIGDYFSKRGAGIFFGWLAFQAVLAMLPVGQAVQERSRKRFKQRFNAFWSLLITAAIYGGLVYRKVPVHEVYNDMVQIMYTATVFSLLLGICFFVRSRKAPASALFQGGNTGSIVHDFIAGREVNPHLGPLNMKIFLEFNVGLLAWAFVNATFVAVDCQTNGKPSVSLMVVTAMQWVYILQNLIFQSGYKTTYESNNTGLGFLSTYGYLVMMPFFYSSQAQYLLVNPQIWNNWMYAPMVLLFVAGCWMFIGSNAQKDGFRRDPYNPAFASLETIPTPSGKKLIASGWWGLCRHPNYLGDIMMAVAWTIPCGISHVMPYVFLMFVVAVLLVRQHQVEDSCRQKHGAAYERYCQRVRYRLIPYVY